MAPPDDPPPDDDPKVKDLLDDATRADLERWFGLPSFQQLAEEGKKAEEPEDPDVVASRERRKKAMDAVDPAMVDRHFARYEYEPEKLIQFRAMLDVVVDPSVARVDQSMIERRFLIAEPREVEIPWQLQDDLKDCTPQAILRDLHRPEIDFEKVFEVIDVAADQRLDVVAAVAEAMTTSWRTRTFERSLAAEGRAIMTDFHRDRRAPLETILPQLWNRKVED